MRATGNGSCLFNLASIALCGDESLAIPLRSLTSIELFSHPQFYANHPVINGHHRNGKPINENTVFSLCISDKAFNHFSKDDRVPSILSKAANTAENFSFSSFATLFALASVLWISIQCYFPVVDDLARDIYEDVFNCCVFPRVPADPISSKPIHIFRCSSAPMNFVSINASNKEKNHYVPLLDPNSNAFCTELPPSLQCTKK